VWDYDPKYFFVAPRATPKPSISPKSTLVGFQLNCGAHAPSGGARPEGALRTREGGSAVHTTFLGAGGAPPACVCVVWDAFQKISSWHPGLPQNRPYRQSQLSWVFHWIVVHTHLQGGLAQKAPCAPGRGGQPATPPSWVPGGPPPRVCAWCGTRFKRYLRGPPGYPKTVHIARVNSRRFSIGLWCTRTFRGGSPRRRPAHTGGAVRPVRRCNRSSREVQNRGARTAKEPVCT